MKGKKIKQAPGGIHSIIDQYNNLHVTYIEDVEKNDATRYLLLSLSLLLLLSNSDRHLDADTLISSPDDGRISNFHRTYTLYRYAMYIVRVFVFYSFGFSAFFFLSHQKQVRSLEQRPQQAYGWDTSSFFFQPFYDNRLYVNIYICMCIYKKKFSFTNLLPGQALPFFISHRSFP